MHRMHLNNLSFTQIKSGRKTTEIRLNDEKRQTIKPGDTIEFTNLKNNEKLQTKVTTLSTAPDFATLYKITDYTKAGWEPDTTQQEYITFIEQFYPKSEQKKHGVLEINLELIRQPL